MGKYILHGSKDVGVDPTPARVFYLEREMDMEEFEPAAAYARARFCDGHCALFYHDSWVHVQSDHQEEFYGIEEVVGDGEDIKRVERRLYGKLMEVVGLLKTSSDGSWTVELEDRTEFAQEEANKS